jgi:hypothetical protein
MDQLKNFTGWSKGRFLAYLAVLFSGLGLAFISRMGFGVYTELPDGTWKWAVEITSTQLDIFIGVLLAGGGSGVFAMIKGLKTRVGDIPAAERTGDKPISGPTVDTPAVKVTG